MDKARTCIKAREKTLAPTTMTCAMMRAKGPTAMAIPRAASERGAARTRRPGGAVAKRAGEGEKGVRGRQGREEEGTTIRAVSSIFGTRRRRRIDPPNIRKSEIKKSKSAGPANRRAVAWHHPITLETYVFQDHHIDGRGPVVP